MPIPRKNRLLALELTLNSPPGASQPQSQPTRSKRRPPGRASKRQGKPSRSRPDQMRHRRRAQVQAQAFDWDEPIELTYSREHNSYVANSTPNVTAYADEDEPLTPVADQLSAWEWDEDDEAAAFEVESFDPEERDADAVDTGNSKVGQSFAVGDLDEATLAEDLDFSDLDAALTRDEPSQAMSDSDFATELQAILSGEKTYDRDRGGTVATAGDRDTLATAASQSQKPETPPASEAESNPHDVFARMSQHMPHNQIDTAPLAQAKSQEEAAKEEERPHDVFDRMGHNMSYANAFDLGSISLEQRFDEFDELLNHEGQTPSTAQSTQLDDLDELLAQEPSRQSKAQSYPENSEAIRAPLALNEAQLEKDLVLMQGEMATALEAEKPEGKQIKLETSEATDKPGETLPDVEAQSVTAQETVPE